MTPPVHILVTCRKPELWPASVMVFKSIRKGFQTAEIRIWGNGLDAGQFELIAQISREIDANFLNYDEFVANKHPAWIEGLIDSEKEPFFICDTDVAFFEDFERFEMRGPISGRLVPKFRCKVMGAITHSRIHTALMYLDPVALREIQEAAMAKLSFETPWRQRNDVSFVRQLTYMHNREWYFHDTMSQFCHAANPSKFKTVVPFNPEQLDCYGHVNCGTYADVADASMPGWKDRVNTFVEYPNMLRGMWKQDDHFYRKSFA